MDGEPRFLEAVARELEAAATQWPKRPRPSGEVRPPLFRPIGRRGRLEPRASVFSALTPKELSPSQDAPHSIQPGSIFFGPNGLHPAEAAWGRKKCGPSPTRPKPVNCSSRGVFGPFRPSRPKIGLTGLRLTSANDLGRHLVPAKIGVWLTASADGALSLCSMDEGIHGLGECVLFSF
jgi:hypothetical protein